MSGALVLSRRNGETIMIGDDIKITVTGIQGTQVKLAIDAPRNIPVHREEIYLRLQREKAAAG